MSDHAKVSGPLFDGTAVTAVQQAQVAIEDAIAARGVQLVRQRLSSVLQHPSGRYERSIRVDRQQDDRMVTDGGMVYGPWLEGTSSRNNTTRFKGYRTFRQTVQVLDQMVPDIAQRELPKYLGRMS
jgi:hypothetical protein